MLLVRVQPGMLNLKMEVHVWIDGEFVPIEKTTMMNGWHVGYGAEPPRLLDVGLIKNDSEDEQTKGGEI